jgi:hypothetical protein
MSIGEQYGEMLELEVQATAFVRYLSPRTLASLCSDIVCHGDCVELWHAAVNELTDKTDFGKSHSMIAAQVNRNRMFRGGEGI